jgi:hypothetical protein
MGQSIGDLFVKLGFDVDDTKLKSFDDSIKSVFNTVLQLAGVTASAAGFTALAKGASDTALTIENLTSKFNVSTNAVQAWASALHAANPLVSRDQGINSIGQFASYLNNAATTTQGASALNQLGVRFSAGDIQHPEKLIAQLFETVPKMLAEHPEKTGRVSDLLDQLFGNVNSINVFRAGKGAYENAAQSGFVSEEDLNRQVRARENLAELGNTWDAFVGHVTASLAGAVIELKHDIENPLPEDKKYPVLSGIGRWVDWLGSKDIYGLGSDSSVFGATRQVGGAIAESVKNGDRATEARRYFESQGWSPAQAAGMVDRLMKESNVNPDAVNPTSGARGIAQWLGSRVKDFKEHAGADLAGSSFEQQLDFVNYELTKGHEQKAGKLLKETQDRHAAELTMRNAYERPDPPAVTLNVTQHIVSSDPDQAGRASQQAIQEQITAAFLNRIGVNP